MRDWSIKENAVNFFSRTQKTRIRILTLFSAGFMGLVLGVALTFYYFSLISGKINDEGIGKLSAFAACSTGQSPTIEWQNAISASEDGRDIFDIEKNNRIASYLTSVIDPHACGASQATSAHHDDGVGF